MRYSFRSLRRSEGGAVAIVFALACVAILIVVSVAIDLQRTVSTKSRVQSAVDAAALAGARTLENANASNAEIVEVAEDVFAANIKTGHDGVECRSLSVNIDRDTGRVIVDAPCAFATTFASLVKIDTVETNSRAAARAAITKLDVAMMLDVSGSMGGAKLDDLKTAAKDAIDILITENTGDRVRVAFDTYATSVNAGAYAEDVTDRPWWLPATSCVSERSNAQAWSDSAPGVGSWLGHKATSCPASSVEPLTSDAGRLKSEIDKLSAGGNTAGHVGVAWAWYLISPDWSAIWPAASKPHDYAERYTKKAAILMTDGEFNTVYEWSQGNSSSQAKKLCRQMRDQGVIVYAVAFDAPNSAKQTLKNCAGDDSRFFEASNGLELNAAYQNIASQLSNLSLTE